MNDTEDELSCLSDTESYMDDLDDLDDLEQISEDALYDILDQIEYDKKQKEIQPEADNCKGCSDGGNRVVHDTVRGIRVCTECGNILEDILDSNPEWNNYSDSGKSDINRCTAPTNPHLVRSSIGTSIATSYRSKVKLLQTWGAMPYDERSLNKVLKEIQFRCRKAELLKYIEDDAIILYKNISKCVHKKGDSKGKRIIIRGTNRKSLIAACVYYACKRKKMTRSHKEMAKIFELETTDITKGCKTFMKLMRICQMEYDFSSSKPEHFIPRYCKKLHLKKDDIDMTIKIADNIKKLNIASIHTPLSVATGSILLIITKKKLPISKKKLAHEFGVSEVTVSKAYKRLKPHFNVIINDDVTDKLAKIMEEDSKEMVIPDIIKRRYDMIKASEDTSDQNQ